MRNKRKRHLELFVVDILVAIKKIKDYTADFKNGADLRRSSIHWDATVREFELIGEALNNLLENQSFKTLAPDYFRKVVNFRNALVHGYFGIAPEELWNIVSEKLDMLFNDLIKISNQIFDLTMAIDASITETIELEDQNLIDFLQSLPAKVKKQQNPEA